MKKGLFVFFFILSVTHGIHATSCGDSTSIQLFTQADVDAFSICDTIDGNLEITSMIMGSSDITDLTPLLGVKVLTGILMIRDVPLLTSLDGLNDIQEASQLMIEENPMLTNINALSGILITTGFITLRTNQSLSQCCALESSITNPMLFVNDAKNLLGGNCNSLASILADTSCDPQSVPTLSQWAMINLSLLLLIVGCISLQSIKTQLLPRVKSMLDEDP